MVEVDRTRGWGVFVHPGPRSGHGGSSSLHSVEGWQRHDAPEKVRKEGETGLRRSDSPGGRSTLSVSVAP